MRYPLTVLLLSGCLSAPVLAQEAADAAEEEEAAPASPLALENFSITLTGVSNYLFRGISNSGNEPAFQPALDWSWNGAYAGIWASNVSDSFDAGADVEVDFLVGYAAELGPLSYDVSFVYYAYPGADESDFEIGEADYWEVIPQISYAFEDVPLSPTIGLLYAFTPDYFGETGDGHDYEVSLGLTLPQEFGLTGTLGHQRYEGTGAGVGDAWNYTYWTIELSKSVFGFDLAVSYTETSDNADRFLGDEGITGDHVVFTIGRTFGF
jgi:uncharacterized protein (TIGR02001 family)